MHSPEGRAGAREATSTSDSLASNWRAVAPIAHRVPASSTLPPVRLARNLRLRAHHELGGAPNVGEGIALKVTPEGRRVLYVAHVGPPMAFSVLDVTDPDRPELVWQLPLAHEQVRGNSLALCGDHLLLAQQTTRPGLAPAGVRIFDIQNPAAPSEVGFFDTSGPHSRGVHLVTCMDGRYAHLTTGAADFEPANPKDHQFHMIVDLLDPTHPVEVGRWWMPGQRRGDTDVLPPRHPVFDHAYRPHHVLVYPERPDRAYIGYIDGGIVILDIADKARPRCVSRMDYHPPFPGFTHTVVPLFDRGLLIVTDEATGDEGIDWPKRTWIVDARVEENPVIIGSLPDPDGFGELHRVGGRIGAHNIHENEPYPGSARLQNTVAATWFSGGLRVYDIGDPFRAEEIAAFLPETPRGQRGSRITDVFIDDRGIFYVGDREQGGLYVLEYTGKRVLD